MRTPPPNRNPTGSSQNSESAGPSTSTSIPVDSGGGLLNTRPPDTHGPTHNITSDPQVPMHTHTTSQVSDPLRPNTRNNLDRLSQIQTLTHQIISAINAGKSVSSENKKLIINLAHEIDKLSRETAVSVDNNNILSDVKSTIENTIKSELSKIKTPSHTSTPGPIVPPTYASVTTLKPTPIVHKPSKPSLIVSSTSDTQNRQEVAEQWRKSINFKDVNYAPSVVRPIGKNKLKVEFDTLPQRDETLKRLEMSTFVRAEPTRKLKPMVILKGVSRETSKDHLIDIILKQNDEINQLKPTSDELQIKFERKNKNIKLYNAVLLTGPSIWKKLMEMGRVNVDHQKVHVEEFIPLLQCYKCLQFGHLKNHCSSSDNPCSHCGDCNHTFNTCPLKNNNDSVKCFNCHNKNIKSKTSTDTKHSSTSNFCPLKIAMKNIVIEKVDYGL